MADHIDFRPLLHDRALSLRRHWQSSPSKWLKLKKILAEHRGARCESCRTRRRPFDGHEEWEYVDIAAAGIDAGLIQAIIADWRTSTEEEAAKLKAETLARFPGVYVESQPISWAKPM